MKRLLKRILPPPAIRAAARVNDRLRLAVMPKSRFSADSLRKASSLNLQSIFNDTAIERAWVEDDNRISELYGRGDTYGGVNPGDRRALYYLITALAPLRVLEVGTHIGASTLYIAAALARVNQAARVTTVDILDVNDNATGPWRQLGLSRSPADFASCLGLKAYIEFCAGHSVSFMAATAKRFDLIFLDGDHRSTAVYSEMSGALPLLVNGGVILLHDYYPDGRALYPDKATITGPFHALSRICGENPSIRVVPLGALPWPTKQGSNLTSLALVCNAG